MSNSIDPRNRIEQALQKALLPVYLKVVDETAKHAGHAGAGRGGNFAVEIVSAAFEGKKAIERHRLVYAALEPVKDLIHALAIKAQSPQDIYSD
jgi:BolA family transcriptional regulator, general stress-responsive regulator